MCKVLAFTNTSKINLRKHTNSIGNTLLKLERDGFGYAVQGAHGVFGEKSVAKTFHTRLYTTQEITLPVVKKLYSKFGTPSAPTGPSIFHGRTSTNDKGLLNCHPMQRDSWHLIHNGVVTDLGDEYKKHTTNDSEDVLHRLMEGYRLMQDAPAERKPMQEIEAHLEGYYAFTAIDPSGKLHVCRDDMATLFMAWSKELDTFIIATTASLLTSVARTLKAKIGPIDEIRENVYMVFNGNELIYSQEFEPLGCSYSQAAFSGASLGREIVVSGTSGNIVDATKGPHVNDWRSERHERGTSWQEKADAEESAYRVWRSEVDAMDASYTVYNEHGIQIDVTTFRKLDAITQELCTIVRPDGSVVGDEYGERVG